MTPLCVRCLEVEPTNSYCPVCGRSLRVATHAPTPEELKRLASDVSSLLVRIRVIRMSLQREWIHLDGPCQATTRELNARRQTHLWRIEQRLQAHLRRAQAELGRFM